MGSRCNKKNLYVTHIGKTKYKKYKFYVHAMCQM